MGAYSPLRVWRVFRLLLSIYLLIKKRPRFLGFGPLEPDALAQSVIVLGTSFIKLVQVLATRNDFFDERYLEVLRSIHDDLPPMGEAEYRRVLGRAFAEWPFETFGETPIASASIGQVHEA
ncbi:MAG: AarF/ABC1/UbiB kinase family protein, partial [Campylobacterales bacterium]|nr:AarF/ABC1/UbiB kinase family protein [Campylobacterales bacterium]